MKKIISFLVISSLLLTLSACGAETTETEDYVWRLRTA